MGSGGLMGAEENKVSLFKQQLDAAAADKRVEAVVLRINSPGGSVAASDVMYELVRDFKKRTGKPVIATCQDVCASGGYYVATAADEIHALPTSVVGSIGVIFETIDLSPLMEKIGVRIAPIQSGPLKDMGSPFNGLSEAEREVMQGMVDEFYARFVNVVRSSREISDESAFDGRVMTGPQALEMNLVDEICQLPATLDRARKLIGEGDARVIMYRRPYGYRGSIYARSSDLAPAADGGASVDPAAWVGRLPIVNEVSQTLQPGFYYLWMP
jgi:protease-4